MMQEVKEFSGQAETNEVVAASGNAPEAVARADAPGIVAPGAAAQNPRDRHYL